LYCSRETINTYITDVVVVNRHTIIIRTTRIQNERLILILTTTRRTLQIPSKINVIISLRIHCVIPFPLSVRGIFRASCVVITCFDRFENRLRATSTATNWIISISHCRRDPYVHAFCNCIIVLTLDAQATGCVWTHRATLPVDTTVYVYSFLPPPTVAQTNDVYKYEYCYCYYHYALCKPKHNTYYIFYTLSGCRTKWWYMVCP